MSASNLTRDRRAWYSTLAANQWESKLSPIDYPFRSWRQKMPRIPDTYLDCVFYLYESEEDAKNGERAGGTGFIIGVPSEVTGTPAHLYAVTCKHVVNPKDTKEFTPSPVIRLNTGRENTRVINLTTSDWKTWEDIYPKKIKHDVAVCELQDIEPIKPIEFIPRQELLTREQAYKMNIGIGDDVFMVGRYIDHAGIQKNTPSVRFGSLAMMSGDPLWHWEGYDEVDNFIVDMRSLSGYSGSPVFVIRQGYRIESDKVVGYYGANPLGIQWSIHPHDEYQPDEKRYVKVYSGMNNVIPIWYIDPLLDWEDFKMQRKNKDRKRVI